MTKQQAELDLSYMLALDNKPTMAVLALRWGVPLDVVRRWLQSWHLKQVKAVCDKEE